MISKLLKMDPRQVASITKVVLSNPNNGYACLLMYLKKREWRFEDGDVRYYPSFQPIIKEYWIGMN